MLHSYSLTPDSWEIDGNNFLRVKTRVMSAGVMTYTREELGAAVPPEFSHLTIINLLVTPDVLADPHSIRTLEGMPITAGTHDWKEAGTMITQSGSIAGTPVVDGPYLVADMVITNSTDVTAVTSRQLCELSAAYDMDIIWGEGEYDGTLYHGRQTRLRYNHTALLPAGKGRAGRDVRVLNNDSINEEKPMTTEKTESLTLVSLPGGVKARVANEDAAKVADAVENAGDDAKKETTSAFNEQVTDLSTQLAESESKVAELRGQLEEMRAQLEAALSPGVVNQKAEEMQQERDQAAKVMNADTLPDDMKALYGHELRAEVVRRVRAQNSAPELSDVEINDEACVRGRFAAMYEHAKVVKPTVTGAKVVTSTVTQNSASNINPNRARFNKLYGKK